MFNNNKVLVVIPARGDSKEIPRRNVRLLCGRPMISYPIEIAKASEYVDDIVVSSDDNETLRYAELYGVHGLRHSTELDDSSSIAEIVHDAMLKKESLIYDEYDIIITILPNATLLKTTTLNNIIERFENSNIETVISVKGNRKLYWVFNSENNAYYQLYPQREHLEFLHKTYQETCNLMASRRKCVNDKSLIGQIVDLFELSTEESVHIDTYDDWGIATNYLNKKKVALVIGVGEGFGLDNLNRCLSLYGRVFFHDVKFFLSEDKKSLTETVDKYNYNYTLFNGTNDLINQLKDFQPEVVFNDIGDSSDKYMSKLKKKTDFFVVNFGDSGPGFEYADLVFDDLYEHNLGQTNIFVGRDYFILKDDFFYQNEKTILPEVNRVVLFFEGKDKNNFTEKILNILIRSGFSKYIQVVLGADYPNKENFAEKYQIYNNVLVYENPKVLADLFFKADIAFTSAGRAMYEACSMGLPTIVLCQDEREVSHVFANKSNGFINLGLGTEVKEDELIHQFNLLGNSSELRQQMHDKMVNIDLKYGFDNIWHEIKKGYRRYRLNK